MGEITTCRRLIVRSRPGFTLIDVLVTMAVVAVLISLLAPSLTSVRETAHQVICRSNVRQIGIGIYQYAEENGERVPTATVVVGTPWDTVTLRLPGGSTDAWDGLGRLYAGGYLPAPKLYYCPSHRGNHRYQQYSPQWGGQSGAIVGNYQYRAGGPMADYPAHNPNAPSTIFLSKIRGSAALLSDGLRSQSDFNHIIGANVLRADLAVDWYRDQGGTLYEMLTKDDGTPTQSGMLAAWLRLDDPG